jgi:hypothetical protein
MYNILYKGRKIYSELTEEECTEVLDELADAYYNNEVDPFEIELEEI